MSRIDEALKRAAKTPVDTGTPTRDRFALASKPRVRVDDFVAESDTPSDDVLAHTPVVDRVEKRLSPSPKMTVTAPSFLTQVPELVEGKLVSLKGMDQTSVEQYRRLAATVHGLQQQNGIKVLMITSSVPREGKTLTATNLALTLSQSYKRRVLLIDGDLRRPFLHEIFGLSNAVGLGDGLRIDAASLPVAQVTPELTVLPAGRPDSDPMAGLSSERMRAILKEAADRFEWVILDTPPVGLLSDANLMAGFVDGVIFVVGAHSTDYQLVEHALTEIGRERVIGIVLNRVDHERTPAYGHYYNTAGHGDGE